MSIPLYGGGVFAVYSVLGQFGVNTAARFTPAGVQFAVTLVTLSAAAALYILNLAYGAL